MPNEELQRTYLTFTNEQLGALRALINLSEAGAVGDHAAHNQSLYEIAHNIKGMGGSFGFDLMTDMGDLLCAYLNACDDNPVQPETLAKFHGGMALVLEHKITGDGGAAGQELLGKLKAQIA